MTVKELITKLEALSPDALVLLPAQELNYSGMDYVEETTAHYDHKSSRWNGDYEISGIGAGEVKVVVLS
jgi:hypothetical protein